MQQVSPERSENHGGPLHYLGNRNLSLPNSIGRMNIDKGWLEEHFSLILANCKGRKYKRCFEPFSGCASWSFAAMELGLADEYIINDSDQGLIHTHRLMKDRPGSMKAIYAVLVKEYSEADSKKDFFLKVVRDYNEGTLDIKSHLLPFIINHSWSGIVFHDDNGHIEYRDAKVKGEIIPGYLDKASLPLDLYFEEVDRVSNLLKSNKVSFKSGDFLEAISDIQPGDFVALNPPYPENERARTKKTGMYTELYAREILHNNLVKTINRMENKGIEYYMTYGFHDPEMKKFIIRDESNQLRHFFRVLGYENCAFGIGLDQMYFSSKITIPNHLSSKIIHSRDVIQDRDLASEEALQNFNRIAMERKFGV